MHLFESPSLSQQVKEGERENGREERQAGRPDGGAGGGIGGNLTATLLAKLFSIDRSSSSIQRRNSPELSWLNLSKSVAEEEEEDDLNTNTVMGREKAET